MNNDEQKQNHGLATEDRRLLVENLAEMRELKGELKEFKLHVMGRVERLEKTDAERRTDLRATMSVIISGAALLISIIANIIRVRG
jgi:uncharacterized protein with von Willebrand factor type A (vWA) domain